MQSRVHCAPGALHSVEHVPRWQDVSHVAPLSQVREQRAWSHVVSHVAPVLQEMSQALELFWHVIWQSAPTSQIMEQPPGGHVMAQRSPALHTHGAFRLHEMARRGGSMGAMSPDRA